MRQLEANGLLHLLCLGAHADDIEIGCGGTIMHLRSRNPQMSVTWIVFSASGPRIAEARNSANQWLTSSLSSPVAERAGQHAETLPTYDVRVESFQDSRFPVEWEGLKSYFQELSTELSGTNAPDLILTHRLHDRHQDHRVIAELTWQAFRDHCVWEYEIPKYDGDLGQPNLYVPLQEPIVSEKCRLLSEGFPSQAQRHWFDEETFRSLLRLRGLEAGQGHRYAEAFEARKLVIV